MRWVLFSVLGLLACDNASPGRLAIHSVEPATWGVTTVPDSVTVEGDGFHFFVVTSLAQSPGVRVRHRFSGSLGGLPIDLELVANGVLEFPPPADLGSGSHELVIVAPDGRTVSAAGAVRVGAGLDLPGIVVTGAADGNDIPAGVTSPTEADAGGEVSLREALLIANGASEAHAIRFAHDLVITIEPIEGELPPITRDGTVIDGSGADVVITGDGATDFHGLVVTANDVTVASIRVQSFNGSDNHCLWVRGDNFHLLDCEFFECDDPAAGSGAQVLFESGTGAVVRSCLFLEGNRDGLRFDAGTSGALIELNRMIANQDDGLNILGAGHVVRANTAQDNDGSGVECVYQWATDILLEGNRLIHNGWGVADPDNGAGISVKLGATDVRIVDNTFEENREDGVRIMSSDTIGITVSRATFSATQSRAIYLREGANGAILPPVIDSFVDLEVSGFAMGADGGTIEIYMVGANGDAIYAVSTTTSGGAWSATLPSAAPTVAATLTIDGSTSELSAFTSR